jgi:hypothetical protein
MCRFPSLTRPLLFGLRRARLDERLHCRHPRRKCSEGTGKSENSQNYMRYWGPAKTCFARFSSVCVRAPTCDLLSDLAQACTYTCVRVLFPSRMLLAPSCASAYAGELSGNRARMGAGNDIPWATF